MAEWSPNREQVRTFVLALVAAVGLYLCYLIALPFLPAITWAVVLTVVVVPLQRRLETRIRPNAAALATVALAAVVVVAPLLFVAQQLVQEAARAAVFLERVFRDGEWQQALQDSPRLAALAAWITARLDLAGMVGGLARWLTGVSTELLQNSAGQIFTLLVTFYLLFFFLRDRAKLRRAIVAVSPVSEEETQWLSRRFVDTVHATVFGTLVVALIQGTLGGLMFWWLDLPLPVIWGLVMALLAIFPMIGAFIVWVPAAIVLAAGGEWVKAAVMVAWGGGVIATIDNILYPFLVGNRLHLHTVPSLIGAIGGVIVFGAAGIVLGPAAIVLTLGLIELLKSRFQPAPAANGMAAGIPTVVDPQDAAGPTAD